MIKSLYPDAEPGSFKASFLCLEKLKWRHGICELVLHGESLSADTALIGPFRENLPAVIDKQNLTYNHISMLMKQGFCGKDCPFAPCATVEKLRPEISKTCHPDGLHKCQRYVQIVTFICPLLQEPQGF